MLNLKLCVQLVCVIAILTQLLTPTKAIEWCSVDQRCRTCDTTGTCSSCHAGYYRNPEGSCVIGTIAGCEMYAYNWSGTATCSCCEYPNYYDGAGVCKMLAPSGYHASPVAATATGLDINPQCGCYYCNGTGNCQAVVATSVNNRKYLTQASITPGYCRNGRVPGTTVETVNVTARVDAYPTGCAYVTQADKLASRACSTCKLGFILKSDYSGCIKNYQSALPEYLNRYGCGQCFNALCTSCSSCAQGYYDTCPISSTYLFDNTTGIKCCQSLSPAKGVADFTKDLDGWEDFRSEAYH